MKKAEVLAMQEREKTFDVAADLEIDKYRLDKECLSHSTLFFRYAEAQAEAKNKLATADDEMKLVLAKRNIEIRKAYDVVGKKFTESVIAAELENDKLVIEAKDKLRKAQETYAAMQVAVQAMDVRKSELDNLVKLYCAGYFSVPQTTGKARENENNRASEAVRAKLNGKGKENDEE